MLLNNTQLRQTNRKAVLLYPVVTASYTAAPFWLRPHQEEMPRVVGGGGDQPRKLRLEPSACTLCPLLARSSKLSCLRNVPPSPLPSSNMCLSLPRAPSLSHPRTRTNRYEKNTVKSVGQGTSHKQKVIPVHHVTLTNSPGGAQ